MHFILPSPHTSMHVCNHILYKKNCNIILQKWGGTGQGRLEFFQKFIWFCSGTLPLLTMSLIELSFTANNTNNKNENSVIFKTSPSLNALSKHFWRLSSHNPNLKTLLASSILPEQLWSKQCYQLDCGTQCWRLRTSPPKPSLPLLTWQLALKMFMLALETSEELKVLIFEKTII